MLENIDNKIPGVSSQKISNLEDIIEGKLPQDYKEFLKQYGFVSLQGRDLFGLGNDKFFNTLKETKELQDNFNLKKNFVAIENVGTESMYLVLNTKDNGVYEWTPKGHLKKIYSSFKEFLEKDFIKD